LFLKVPRLFQRIGNFNQFDQVQRASQQTFTGLWIRNPPSILEVSSAGCKWKPWPYNMPLHHVPLFLLPENQTKNPPKPGSIRLERSKTFTVLPESFLPSPCGKSTVPHKNYVHIYEIAEETPQ
jgi:hypothetical protein